ncbi:ABC transporter ATP-binding protein [Kroppenstedtia pulmonis]|uniref:ABC transporter ATP-binding protein n=1 Tax=Kroppenstedtia pulmonis TaxID=1380685 RepID=A0A7D4CHH7_9BACL|nr:ABC transporter ATP-binding protein [Kroppenstedtia pulmonis]QKG85514.1 ABC transporter ATP-binding protein [Kroppenstedtia pulmonis]
MYAVEIRNVHKQLGKEMVLDDINLTVSEGEIIGLIGHNGSGKTMLLRLISGLIYPTQGEVKVFGKKMDQHNGYIPNDLGVLIESPGLLSAYSAEKNLQLLASIRGKINKEEIRNTLKTVRLDPQNKKAVKTFSLGMRQKLGIAQAIMEKPKLLLLDEPTNSLDPESVDHILSLFKQMNERDQTTIILASHHHDEIGQICHRVFQMKQGRLQENTSGQKSTASVQESH